MEPLELLIQGVIGLGATALGIVAARARFRSEESDDAPTDIGLD